MLCAFRARSLTFVTVSRITSSCFTVVWRSTPLALKCFTRTRSSGRSHLAEPCLNPRTGGLAIANAAIRSRQASLSACGGFNIAGPANSSSPSCSRASRVHDAAVVGLGFEKDELALYHVLGLQPVLRGTATVETGGPLRDNALQPEFGGQLEEQSTIAVGMVAELTGSGEPRRGDAVPTKAPRALSPWSAAMAGEPLRPCGGVIAYPPGIEGASCSWRPLNSRVPGFVGSGECRYSGNSYAGVGVVC